MDKKIIHPAQNQEASEQPQKKQAYYRVKNFLLFFVLAIFVATFFWAIERFFNHHGNFFSEGVKASFYDGIKQGAEGSTKSQLSTNPDIQQVLDSNINAQSYISVNIQAGQGKILFSKNERERLPMASLAKLMTALVVLETYDLAQKVTVSESAIKQDGEQGNLKTGQVLSVKNLLYITLIESSNRAAFALSQVMGTNKFIAAMNDTTKALGLVNTHFEDVTGLDARSYSTAEDMAKLSGYLFENYPLFKEIISFKEFDLYLDNGVFHHKLTSTNELLGKIPDIVGGKTGWTDIARGCFMVIVKDAQNDTYTMHVILKAEDRFLEMEKLIYWINANYP